MTERIPAASQISTQFQILFSVHIQKMRRASCNCWYCFLILQNTCLNDPKVDFKQFLQDIAAEQKFEVTYVDIEEKSYSGQYQCLVQLSTLPVAVCQGSGNTIDIAKMSAARNALEYLKIMTKS